MPRALASDRSARVRSPAFPSGALDRQWRLASEEAGLIRGAHKEDGGCVSGGGRYNVAPLVLPLTHLRLASRARASPNQTIAKVYREASLSDVTLCSLDPPFMRLVSARNSAKEGTYFHFV